MCCRYVPEPHGGTAARHAKARELLYGCQDGRLVQLLVDAGAVRQGFVINGAPDSKEGMRSAITAIHCGADYSKVSSCLTTAVAAVLLMERAVCLWCAHMPLLST